MAAAAAAAAAAAVAGVVVGAVAVVVVVDKNRLQRNNWASRRKSTRGSRQMEKKNIDKRHSLSICIFDFTGSSRHQGTACRLNNPNPRTQEDWGAASTDAASAVPPPYYCCCC